MDTVNTFSGFVGLTVLLGASCLCLGADETPSTVRLVDLPYGMEGNQLVIRNAEQWREYEQRRTHQRPAAPPCDWAQSMLVAWRPEFGVSGCTAPEATLDKVEIVEGALVVHARLGPSSGSCNAHFQPIVAACVPASDLPVRMESNVHSCVYVEDWTNC